MVSHKRCHTRRCQRSRGRRLRDRHCHCRLRRRCTASIPRLIRQYRAGARAKHRDGRAIQATRATDARARRCDRERHRIARGASARRYRERAACRKRRTGRRGGEVADRLACETNRDVLRDLHRIVIVAVACLISCDRAGANAEHRHGRGTNRAHAAGERGIGDRIVGVRCRARRQRSDRERSIGREGMARRVLRRKGNRLVRSADAQGLRRCTLRIVRVADLRGDDDAVVGARIDSGHDARARRQAIGRAGRIGDRIA